MQRIKSITWFLVIILSLFCSCIRDNSKFNHHNEISKYKKLLLEKPNNCFYLGQVARSYQSINDFDKSINYFQKAIAACPNNSLNIFQLGISHYLIMNKEKGIAYMDKAIRMEAEAGNAKASENFRKEKLACLEKWEQVKKLDWNKHKKQE